MNTDNKMKELKDAAHAAESTYNVAHDVARDAYDGHDTSAAIAACDAASVAWSAASVAWDAYIAYIETAAYADD